MLRLQQFWPTMIWSHDAIFINCIQLIAPKWGRWYGLAPGCKPPIGLLYIHSFICCACRNLLPFIMATNQSVTSSGDSASKKREVITMEIKLNIVKCSEKGRNSDKYWPVAWFKLFNCSFKSKKKKKTYILWKSICIQVRDKDICTVKL